MATTWQETAKKVQTELAAQIPDAWRLPAELTTSAKLRNVLPLFKSCGILTTKELEITDVEDATTLLDKIAAGTWTALEVTTAYCKRAIIAQQLVNCLIEFDIDGALNRAKELDEHFKATGKVVGPLHGLPVSIKDLTHVKGMRMTIGLVSEANRRTDDDAIVVQTLRKAGAVIYVKTTMPQTGMALETTSNLWGRTLNPFNTDLVSGGSSGGEGALNACHGAPIGIATDIGGSIRAPAAFNGLYGIRPTCRRFSYMGNAYFTGQVAILSTIGPVGRSLRDIGTMLKVWNEFEPWLYDPAVMAKKWEPVPTPSKATIGVMYWDEVVMPHPPVQRALKMTVEKLKAAGHEVVEFKPYKQKYAWDLAFKHYFQTGGKDAKDFIAKTGEPTVPAVAKLMSQAKELGIHELIQCFKDQRQYQTEYLAHWAATADLTSTGKPVDAILSPSFASCSYPHDFLPWWGYLTTWNLLDYPTIIMPVTEVRADDAKDTSYTPVNSIDQETYDMYEPEIYEGMPVCVQLIGRSMMEEQLLATAMAVDKAVKQ